MLYQQTSRDAFESFRLHASDITLDEQILSALSWSGGATCQAVEEAIKRDHQSVSGNMRHLVENGFVRPSGRYGKTRSGRKAIIWARVPESSKVAA
jgi:predicted transcriptional regulator